MKAGLNAPLDDGFEVAFWPTAEGGGRAGSEAGRFEDEELRPGGGG